MAVDTNGFPYAIHITTATVTDRNHTLELLELNKENLCFVIDILCDGGYAGEAFAKKVEQMIGSNTKIAK